jgi:hypothetical protein
MRTDLYRRDARQIRQLLRAAEAQLNHFENNTDPAHLARTGHTGLGEPMRFAMVAHFLRQAMKPANRAAARGTREEAS